MIKIFRGGAGVVTPSKPPPPTNNFCLYPPPIFRCFWKDPLMTPTPHYPTSSTFHYYPPPHPPPLLPPPPPKNFDHTHSLRLQFRSLETWNMHDKNILRWGPILNWWSSRSVTWYAYLKHRRCAWDWEEKWSRIFCGIHF